MTWCRNVWKRKINIIFFLADLLLCASTAILRSSNLHFSNARSWGFRLRKGQKVTESKIMFCNHRFSSQPCPFIPKKIRVDASATNFSLKTVKKKKLLPVPPPRAASLYARVPFARSTWTVRYLFHNDNPQRMCHVKVYLYKHSYNSHQRLHKKKIHIYKTETKKSFLYLKIKLWFYSSNNCSHFSWYFGNSNTVQVIL